MNDFQKFCLDAYTQFYENRKQELSSGNCSLSKSKSEKIETDAQKFAIRETFIAGAKHFQHLDVAEIWNAIFSAHMYRKSGISDKETIDKVVGADQSWKKSSGHAFEEIIRELGNLSLKDTDAKLILQRDLNVLIKMSMLGNEPRDISWLKEQIKGNIFDLYAIIEAHGKTFCFGCIQAKTSIRDRVTRDREPSIHAMQSFFWSAIVVLDGDFLKLPKFAHMVNGGSEEFRENGWHGMYVFSELQDNDRIYGTNLDLDVFKSHLQQAARQWLTQRQWMNHEWRAEDESLPTNSFAGLPKA